MRPILAILVVLGAAWLPAPGQTPIWVTPDVPTDESVSGNQMLPWEIWEYDGAGYTLALAVPGNPDLNAIHMMDVPGDWLFSVEAPSALGGALLPPGSVAEARDVVWYDASAGTYQLCAAGGALGIPPGSGIDAIHMDGGDTGDLIVSFDVPTDVTGFVGTFAPTDLVRFVSAGIGVCAGYSIAAANPDFASGAAGVAISSSADGADGIPGVERIFAFDIPTDLSAVLSGPGAVIPGQIAKYDTLLGTWQLHVILGGWPISSVVDGLSCGATTPGRVDPASIRMDKASSPAGWFEITWPGSCAAGAQDYAIYRGNLGNWTSHTWLDCDDNVAPAGSETIHPGTASQDYYYLVVPQNECLGTEGSYGRCSPGKCLAGDERSVGTSVCEPSQVVPTPPACP